MNAPARSGTLEIRIYTVKHLVTRQALRGEPG